MCHETWQVHVETDAHEAENMESMMTGGSFGAAQPRTRAGAPKQPGRSFRMGPGMTPLTTLSYLNNQAQST